MLNTSLDIILALSYVFLVLSLIVTSATELFASLIGLRAKYLESGIASLLQGKNATDKFFANPLIQGLSYKPGDPKSRASYIAAQDFASVVYQDICGAMKVAVQTPADLKSLIDNLTAYPNLQVKLRTLAFDVDHDIDSFKQQLEDWFNRGMDRASGWYKRHTQVLNFCLGLVVVIGLNANALTIAQKLAVDPAARTALVNAAKNKAGESQDTTSSTSPNAQLNHSSTNTAPVAPAGLPDQPLPNASNSAPSSGSDSSKLSQVDQPDPAVIDLIGWGALPAQIKEAGGAYSIPLIADTLVGWLLTAVAVSLGAPFWFDLLQRIIAIRGAGKVPDDDGNSNFAASDSASS